MKVFIIGGCNTVVNALLQKFNKEGLKLYVLTGSHQYHNKYKHVYEQYHFSYENNCIKEVFESVCPDVTIFTGAFDSNYHWENGFREITSYCSGLYNILTAYSFYNTDVLSICLLMKYPGLQRMNILQLQNRWQNRKTVP